MSRPVVPGVTAAVFFVVCVLFIIGLAKGLALMIGAAAFVAATAH